ncbi:glucose-1-phosphate adenylyltransferase [Luteococcus japonicus]|uniref:Glucose-1-phosphate adenylyltransferase n=1 Tax=Luteococcus japonicus TaxID=33984 RepID=A0A3N1ZX34_9ACTN|nr:sugar phosphate nucleotidyltransferase [Luteococcus japonicus]ROR54712.1 glucose-1-phosphate adenylyltransferase [Luteococcus japonicus]
MESLAVDTDRVLAIVLAGGKGSRMDVLTQRRAKPTLPFGGVFSLLDICLSNLVNSHVRDVWVVVQYHASSFDPVLAHGRPWDLDRNLGGLRVLPPQQGIGDEEEGMATGNADSLFRIRRLISQHDPEVVLVLSADHVYSLDHREVLRTHREAGAECTVVTTTIGLEEVGHHTLVDVDEDGRVTGVHHKPDEPHTETIASEVFAYDAKVLVEILDGLRERLGGEAPDGDSGLGDFSEHLLPELVQRGKVVAHELPGYWRDLGRPSAYFRAHQDLLAGDLGILHSRDWPMRTASPQGPAARVHEGAEVLDAMLGNGSEIHGRVERCVIGPDVVVEAGAVVHDAVLMRGVHVRRDARIGWSVLDARCEIGAGARVGAEEAQDATSRLKSEEVTLVGMDAAVAAGAEVPHGSRVEPGTTVS